MEVCRISNSFAVRPQLKSCNFLSQNNSAYATSKQISDYNPMYYMPTFKGRDTAFIKELNNFVKKGSLSKDEENEFKERLQELVKETVNDNSKLLGEGQFGKVYRINDDYVMKVYKNADYENLSRTELKLGDAEIFNIPNYYGGVIASCGPVSILKNASPKGSAIVSGAPSQLPIEQALEYQANVSLPAFSKLPQEAYDKLALSFKEMNKIVEQEYGRTYHYIPDTINPNNFIISSNEIRIVDELSRTRTSIEPNNIITMFEATLNKVNTLNKSNFDENLIPLRKDIFKKCIFAAEKQELPMELTQIEMQWFSDISKLAGYRFSGAKIIKEIKNLRNTEPDINVRLEKLNTFLKNLDEDMKIWDNPF